jgi:hypothetical protein
MSFALPFFHDSVGSTVRQISPNQALIYGLKVVNTTAAAAYLQIFGKPSTSVALGTDTPDVVIPLAASESLYIPLPLPIKISDASGLSVAGTTTAMGSSAAILKVTAFYG